MFRSPAGKARATAGPAAWLIRASALVLVASGTAAAAAAAARPAAGQPLAVYPAGAPAGHSGGFGEPSCSSCHFGEPLDAPAGTLVLEGVPTAYVAGRSYPLTIRLAHGEMRAAGFQLTSRTAAGDQAGTLASVDDRTGIEPLAGVQYIGHTESSAPAPRGRASWTVAWTAPAAGAGTIVFTMAANAADGDESPLGDLIYTRADSSRPAGGR